MHNQSLPKLPAAIFDRLLENINPHRPAFNQQVRHAQRLAGRWLALRRTERALVLPQLAAKVGVSAEVLQCLEAGIAEPGQLPAYAQTRLCNALAQSRAQIDWIAQVMALALGDAALLGGPVIERVLYDLEKADPARSSEVLLEIEITLPEAPAGNPLELLAREPLAVAILQALAQTSDHSPDSLWVAIDPGQTRFEIAAHIGGLLQMLRETGLVRTTRQELDPDFDDEPIVFYCITPEGRQALYQHAPSPAPSTTPVFRPAL